MYVCMYMQIYTSGKGCLLTFQRVLNYFFLPKFSNILPFFALFNNFLSFF